MESVLKAVEQALQGLRYGTVQLIVHDGELVRIERIEKIRLTGSSGGQTQTPGRPTPS